jgi:NADP-dependent 3-hydroxy acid dehydrogenase YdfG
MPSRRLDDDVAYVTGASSGIGLAVSLELARAGAALALGARREARLAEAAERLRAEVPGARVFTHPLDVNDAGSRASWIAAAEAAAGPCSILVHNAGLALGRRAVADEDLREADTMLDTNVRSVIALSRALLPGHDREEQG